MCELMAGERHGHSMLCVNRPWPLKMESIGLSWNIG